MGVNELSCHFRRIFLFKYTFIGLPHAKEMDIWGWVVGSFCVVECASYMYMYATASIKSVKLILAEYTYTNYM